VQGSLAHLRLLQDLILTNQHDFNVELQSKPSTFLTLVWPRLPGRNCQFLDSHPVADACI